MAPYAGGCHGADLDVRDVGLERCNIRSQHCALQARNHIATLRRARPGTTIEIQRCPAHKGVAGNEEADEWATIAAEEPLITRGILLVWYEQKLQHIGSTNFPPTAHRTIDRCPYQYRQR